MRSGNNFDEYELPNGIKQIGSGIGFTYTVPAASRSKSSICNAGAPRRPHSIMPAFGLGLGLRTLGILRARSWREGQGGSESVRCSTEHQRRYGPYDTVTQMDSLLEDVAGEEVEKQDVFRYDSRWSMVPVDLCHAPISPQLSPVTATDSTVYSPLAGF
ncbi:hypothetical protein BDP27DRAFT_245688 [Rhodocollybia butyracea]|uniref:Uncharacterized protein n=1 Tax=Rhodocollybia butyracea TaxID=206335 RepID=A0A9P5Q3H8_9AGAR|nr:hypothetical protein BDP27DRAFT_245688 [Rhodocollybia butyracea]